MNDFYLPVALLGSWTIFSVYYLRRAYDKPASINPYILDSIPSVFPTLGILCTAAGITMGLSEFNTNDIQGSLPKLLGGLKSAFWATIIGIFGLIVFQKLLAIVQYHIEKSPDRPRQSSDELSALDAISHSLEKLSEGMRGDLSTIYKTIQTSNERNANLLEEVSRLINTQATATADFHKRSLNSGALIVSTLETSIIAQETNNKNLSNGVNSLLKGMSDNNVLLTGKFDEFSILMRKNNTEALVEVMRKSTEQFNAQMSALIDKLVKENFKELNNSVLMLNTWQRENKEQVAQLTGQVRTIVGEVNTATNDLKTASTTLQAVAKLSQELVNDDSKLLQLVKELDKVMISDGKFTSIVDKVEGTINTLSQTTDSFDETTNKLNVWVRNQMNFGDKAEILIKQLEEFRNLNGSVWDRYRAEMEKSVKIVAQTSKTLNDDLENINQEFYDRLNDTLQNLDGLIQRFMNGQTTTRRS